jgi:putative aldouronate transport system permease protein
MVNRTQKKSKIKMGNEGIIGTILIYVVIVSAAFITLYPFIYVIANSFSSVYEVLRRSVWLIPKKFTLNNYREFLKETDALIAYKNTIWYTVVGTIVNIVFTTMAGYALSVRRFFLRRQISLFIVVTMFVSGGIIPSYIVVNGLGMIDSRWALILPTAINAYNLIIARSFFESLPDALAESAYLDGANDIVVLVKIILPVSKAILAVLVIFYAVGHWNEYFNPMIYISSRHLKPIQLYLRDILVANSNSMTTQGIGTGNERTFLYEALRFSSIVIMVLPITAIYPFFQKYFVKGVMIGAVKS